MLFAPSDRVPDSLAGRTFDNDRVLMKEVIGSGTFGKVFRAEDFEANLEVAVKVMVTPPPGSSGSLALRNELSIHSAVSSHPNVITVREKFMKGPYTVVVMDLCSAGDLFDHIQTNAFRYHDPILRKIILQIIDGLAHCHGKGVYHRDLKPDNILCSKDGNEVYLADFGLATTQIVSRSFRVGTRGFMSPECLSEDVFAGGYYPELSDLWSLGVIIIDLLTGLRPWDRASSRDSDYRAFRHDPYYIANMSAVPLSRQCIDLIKGLLTTDPMARTSLEDLRKGILNLKSFYDPSAVSPLIPAAMHKPSIARSPVVHSPMLGGSDDTDSDDDGVHKITIPLVSPALGAVCERCLRCV